MKISTRLALTFASGGISSGVETFNEMHKAITHVLGWDVFTHELAAASVWQQAKENVHAVSEPLKRFGEELRDNRPLWGIAEVEAKIDELFARCIAEVGEFVDIPKGSGECRAFQ